jgi:formylglycine-generating enzyme required for sulfatase activity
MAIVHQREVGLPKERVRLYSLAVEVLLSRWQKRKGSSVSPALAALLDDDLRMRHILEVLAYQAHRAQAGDSDAGDLSRIEILTLLEEPGHLGDIALAAAFLDYVDQRAGLLVGRGGGEEKRHPQLYSFPHRTFQEYLAGCQMINGRGIHREYLARAAEGDFWYLPAQMGAEELRYNRRSPQDVLDLAYDLCREAAPADETAWRATVWSGWMASQMDRAEIERDAERPDGGAAYLERMIPRLIDAMRADQALGPVERAEAGNALARLGDPRPEVMTLEGMQFCWVPPGPFIMGSGDDEPVSSHEKPQHEAITDGFWVGRYPITNAQFRVFMHSGAYAVDRYWSEAEIYGFWQRDREMATHLAPWAEGTSYERCNHPVAGIVWFEAIAFCHWLSEYAATRDWIPKGWFVTLPYETQWEKAARGGDSVCKIIRAISALESPISPEITANRETKRVYPWGSQPDPNCANYGEARIGTTNAIGCFPGGASPIGAEEMSGNVYEWTYNPAYKYPTSLDARGSIPISGPFRQRINRGGAYHCSQNNIRCARRWDGDSANEGYIDLGFRVIICRAPSSSE